MVLDIEKYTDLITEAVAYFWNTRNKQLGDQMNREVKDAGNRGAVTAEGSRWMDLSLC